MKTRPALLHVMLVILFLAGCSTAYKAKPLPFKPADSYPNKQEVAGALLGAYAYSNRQKATEDFGFDVIGAGLLPVQVVFDNRGAHGLEINPRQSFLEDGDGNLWPVLSQEEAYRRASKFSQTRNVFKEGAYSGFLGAAAGGLIGAAIGIVTGEGVAASAGKGAAVGAAAGATLGGAKGLEDRDPKRAISRDLRKKSLANREIPPGDIAFGFLFYPGEAKNPIRLRLQLIETDTQKVHVVEFGL